MLAEHEGHVGKPFPLGGGQLPFHPQDRRAREAEPAAQLHILAGDSGVIAVDSPQVRIRQVAFPPHSKSTSGVQHGLRRSIFRKNGLVAGSIRKRTTQDSGRNCADSVRRLWLFESPLDITFSTNSGSAIRARAPCRRCSPLPREPQVRWRASRLQHGGSQCVAPSRHSMCGLRQLVRIPARAMRLRPKRK